MKDKNKRFPLGKCKENHKNSILQCNLVTGKSLEIHLKLSSLKLNLIFILDKVQNDFNRQYWNFKKEGQDNCLLNSIKFIVKNANEFDYKYFIFGYQVCR